MKVLDSAAMKEADRRTIEEYGLPGAVLMETAALRVTEFILAGWKKTDRVVVVAGPGNNGGDGLVIARLLAAAGFSPLLWSTVRPGGYRGDAGINEVFLNKLSFPVRRLLAADDLAHFSRDLADASLVVDAIFGTGLDRPVTGLPAALIATINESALPVLSVDIPSGLNADSGAVMAEAVRADWTITLAFPKKGLFLYPGAALAGEIMVAEINIPPALVENEPLELIRPAAVSRLLPPPPPTAHKGSRGRVLLVAGSPGMGGAALLAAESALRGGAGLVFLAAPAAICPELAAASMEVITISLPEKEPGVIDSAAAGEIISRLKTCDVLAAGPGLKPGAETLRLLDVLIRQSPVPLVLDAGALEALKDNTGLLAGAAQPPVITPHPGEMARLAGMTVEEVQAGRLDTALRCARLWKAIVLLKGYNTVIAAPDGRAAFNPTGGPALATAGSGDLLTGLIASLIAQGVAPENAARAGAFSHGLAGDLLPPGRGHLARDIMGRYNEAFQLLSAQDTGLLYPFLARVRPGPETKPGLQS